MGLNKIVIRDLDLKGKRTFIRVDFNVPFDEANNITDDNRVRAALPTINMAIEKGAKVILASHLGRPKGKPNPKYTLQPVAKCLEGLLNKKVAFAPDCIGPEVEKMVADMKDGDVLLLENVRFHAEEEKNDPEFSKSLAKLADVYVNDAFGTAHRGHATTEGMTKFVSTSAAGLLMEKELNYLLVSVESPVKPFVAIVGGAKVSGKIGVLDHLATKVDKVIVGGGMANTFFKAMGYEIGDSLCEDDMLDVAKKVMAKMKELNVKFLLPVDCLIAEKAEQGAPTQVAPASKVPAGWRILDIGPESAKLFADALSDAKTVVWNGPMGLFEIDTFAKGTFDLAHAVANTQATTIIGGGDSVLAVKRAGVTDKVSFISTGGGASLELLEGKVLPGVAALTNK
uniref:Phosphoglycerate kinase n=1 Tax=uncultured Nitrospirae bacterium MY2-3C TaxID=798577 RepID=D9MNZ1_9BACT|nr:phosphoglycerate kinase [uncultured Nitrospirae bacterium MY2-3C]